MSYSNNVCEGRCIRCLSTTDEHFNEGDDEDEIVCGDCGRTFLQISCYQIHKSRKLNGVYETYCIFYAL